MKKFLFLLIAGFCTVQLSGNIGAVPTPPPTNKSLSEGFSGIVKLFPNGSTTLIISPCLSGLVFLWWTIANLVPRANAIWCRYREEFGDAVGERKRVFPFLY